MIDKKTSTHTKYTKTDPSRNAWLHNTSWVVYAEGFKRAAEILIENVSNTFEKNTVIFPILALFRQYVELTLKEIISYANILKNTMFGRVVIF